MKKLPFVWMFYKGERPSWGQTLGSDRSPRHPFFRTPWHDPGGAKDQITAPARHAVGRRSRQGS
ncbi:hypothetical protein [Streptomyces sasae]|uniref:hypothetical protein n=1 Tax=Streptomyces sasae TaxID=1266772 RepID=UPI00292DDB1B|nr:hypothetical protein [Streptomyces sasae]